MMCFIIVQILCYGDTGWHALTERLWFLVCRDNKQQCINYDSYPIEEYEDAYNMVTNLMKTSYHTTEEVELHAELHDLVHVQQPNTVV